MKQYESALTIYIRFLILPCSVLKTLIEFATKESHFIFDGVRMVHPSVTDPVASIFSPGFRKKRHWVGKFSTRFPLSFRSLFCLFQTYTNDICWVGKSRTGEATNWSAKIKNFIRYQERLNFHWAKGKNPLCRVSLSLL